MWGRVSGDCAECGGSLLWGGVRWVEHTQDEHDGTRRRLLGAVARLLRREAAARRRGAHAGVQDCVALRWRCGALRGPGNEWWTDVPSELLGDWERDPVFRHDNLRALRITLAEHVERMHGMTVNPATFTFRMYDGRPDYEGNMRRFEQDLLAGTVGGSLSTPVPLPPADPREPQGTTPDGK